MTVMPPLRPGGHLRCPSSRSTSNLTRVRALAAAAMGLFRIRLSSFMLGAAVTGAFAVYQLRQDLWSSHDVLLSQTQGSVQALEGRIATLEERIAKLDK
eukprot:jgi/Tetstr1/440043/TSEL_028402.t1